MKLADVRRLAVKRGLQVRFSLAGGLECVINEHGVAQVPGLNAPPEFNLEDEFAQAATFRTGPSQTLSRAELETLVASAGTPVGSHQPEADA